MINILECYFVSGALARDYVLCDEVIEETDFPDGMNVGSQSVYAVGEEGGGGGGVDERGSPIRPTGRISLVHHPASAPSTPINCKRVKLLYLFLSFLAEPPWLCAYMSSNVLHPCVDVFEFNSACRRHPYMAAIFRYCFVYDVCKIIAFVNFQD